MITGFNTDVEHEGVVYHVQTEDKGLKSPLILSLVYVGGTILASKRTPYEDLLATGFSEQQLAERLQRQHKLICAAIHAGRIEDLKRQTERERQSGVESLESGVNVSEVGKPQEVSTPQEAFDSEIQTPPHLLPDQEIPPAQDNVQSAPPQSFQPREESDLIMSDNLADFMPPSIYVAPPPAQRSEPPTEVFEQPLPPPPLEYEHVDYSRVVNYAEAERATDDLQLALLEERKFVAGEFVKLQLRVARGQESSRNVAHAKVTLKVLGSTFRPLIFTEQTGTDGIVTFYVMLPYFTAGRAAILATVTDKGKKAELRRVIHQA